MDETAGVGVSRGEGSIEEGFEVTIRISTHKSRDASTARVSSWSLTIDAIGTVAIGIGGIFRLSDVLDFGHGVRG